MSMMSHSKTPKKSIQDDEHGLPVPTWNSKPETLNSPSPLPLCSLPDIVNRFSSPSQAEDFEMIEGIVRSAHGTRQLRSALAPRTNASQVMDSEASITGEDTPIPRFEFEDPENPRNWSVRKKCLTGTFVMYSAFVATLGTPIYIGASPLIAQAFSLSIPLSLLPLSLYAIGIGFGALLGTSITEIYGRTVIYKLTIPFAILFTILGGAAQAFPTIAIARTCAGIFNGPSLTVGVGTINDMWDVSLDKIGTAFGVLLVLVIIWATQVGPMISAAIVVGKDISVPASSLASWRLTFWANAIFLGLVLVWAFCVPETYAPHLLRQRAQKQSLKIPERNVIKLIVIAVRRPLHMMITEPIIFPSGLVMAITQSVVFSFYVAYAVLFETIYDFTPYQVGMSFCPMVIGSLSAVPIVAYLDRTTYQPARAMAINSGTMVAPEKRLLPAMLGTILMPVSLFWLAFSGRRTLHWIVPSASGCFFGTSYVLNMLCIPVYNNDIYGSRYGASALAATTFLRFSLSSCFPLFTKHMIDHLGMSFAISVLGMVTLALVPIPWIFYRWGPDLRARSTYL